MKFRIEDRITEQIKVEGRSLALSTMPGMGLTTILHSIGQQNLGLFLYLKPEILIELWEKEYKQRERNRRFVLHAGVVSVIKQYFSLPYPADEELFRINLPSFFGKESFPSEYNTIFVVIDNFNIIPYDLSVIILDETKFLDDHRDDPAYEAIKGLKFLIGGPFDFKTVYKEKAKKEVSPATNFAKHRPHEFLLSDDESRSLIEDKYKGLENDEIQFVIEWSNGYLHYVISLSKWVEAHKKEYGDDCSLQHLLMKLKEAVEENDAKEIFSYCFLGWKLFKDDDEALSLLEKASSAGCVFTLSNKARDLVCAGLLIQKILQADVYYFPNQIVELFVRQKLSEKKRVLPIADSGCWIIKEQNIKAYAQLLEIENRLRNFIGDTLFKQCSCEAVEDVIEKIKTGLNDADPDHKKGTRWKEVLFYRKTGEESSPFSSGETFDPILMFLDFADLGDIISVSAKYFDDALVAMLPTFLDELNFIRRRIAHNRPITNLQLSDLTSRWAKIQRMMAKQ